MILKRRLGEENEKSDKDFNEGLNKVLSTMDNISSAIQQNVGILAQLVVSYSTGSTRLGIFGGTFRTTL